MGARDRLPLPGMALTQAPYYPGRGVLASNEQLLESPPNTPGNRAAFTNFVSFSETRPSGLEAINYVTFNGSLSGFPALNSSNDLFIYYQYYGLYLQYWNVLEICVLTYYSQRRFQ